MSEESRVGVDEEQATILVGTFTREELLGEPERIDFPQPYIPDRGERMRRIAAEVAAKKADENEEPPAEDD